VLAKADTVQYPKNHKAGLVGPAFFSWNWFGKSCFDGRPRMCTQSLGAVC